ncbi:MAG: lysophospholipid acyltransferase family protein [Pyrinomonadaceae bacterium]
MLRRILTAVLRLTLRIFFRRIEVNGLEHVPLTEPVIFVLNHPNALVDPIFLLCLAPRKVSFLAKAPLFRMPVIGYLVRAMDALPVYRKQDAGEDTSKNRETFEMARALLKRGGTIAICPEGVSHDEPRLRPLKTGAARIALSAESAGKPLGLKIVPAGLYYTAKKSFRSSALLYFGAPLAVEPVALDENGEPARTEVRALSDRIECALRLVMLDAQHEEALQTISRAERIFSSSEEQSAGTEQTLTRELRLRRRFVEGYAWLLARAPERLAELDARMRRYEAELRQAGVDPEDLSAPLSSKFQIAGQLISRLLLFLLLFPFANFGLLIHFPAYKLAGYFAVRFSANSDDVVSTIKIIAAMLLFPLTWMTIALLCYFRFGWLLASLALLFMPFAGYAAVRFNEKFDQFIGGARAVVYFITRRRFFLQLLAERNAIRKELLALVDEAAREAS